jgi:hypothetical protein
MVARHLRGTRKNWDRPAQHAQELIDNEREMWRVWHDSNVRPAAWKAGRRARKVNGIKGLHGPKRVKAGRDNPATASRARLKKAPTSGDRPTGGMNREKRIIHLNGR